MFDDLSDEENDELGALMFDIGIEYNEDSLPMFNNLIDFLSKNSRWTRVIPQTQKDVLDMASEYGLEISYD